LTQSEIGVLEEFVVIMYDRSSSTNKVNDARLNLFARKQRPYNGIPPSRAALISYICALRMRQNTGCSGFIGRERPNIQSNYSCIEQYKVILT
jgi:hypothetical protein